MNYQTIEIRHEGAIDWLTLNRPERLNAITPEMCDELQHYFGGLQFNHAVRVVMLRGAGRGLCAGYDLFAADGVSAGPVVGMRFQRQVAEVYLRMRRCPQPIVCLAHGAATGGGFAFVLASDVRVVTPDVKMNVAMVKIGLTGCDVGISYFLPRAVGQSVAAELMMTGRMISAERAERLGLVSAVVPFDDLEATARDIADDMLKTSPLGLRLTKEGLNLSVDAPSLDAAVAMEDRGQILCASAGFFEEGINAFLAKRAADYKD
ncbi:MAG: enoyl-CoA hydratase/isomerase family protein [Proteobacteria bacterium]|jgi:enoyl-CoA hydratase/carnithine racemase|nr:enoyl-CoA hydratase/isomerase family protein [Pseudomonadota bacterium]